MSRTVLQNEAATNPRDDYRLSLQSFLKKYPAKDHYSFGFDAGNSDDWGFRVIISVIYPDGKPTPLGNVALESVPMIKQYLHSTGALKLLYEGIRRDTLAELEQVREQLDVVELLPKAESIIVQLQEILYRDGPNTEWNSDTLEEIGRLMTDNSLVPPEETRDEADTQADG